MNNLQNEIDKILLGGGGHTWQRRKLTALFTRALEDQKQELRAKFGIEADKQYDVKIGNGVIVAQLSTPPKKEEV